MTKCLIVDESSVVRKVAARIVFQLGYEVAEASTLEDAQARIAAAQMPGLLVVAADSGNGEAVAAFLRAARARPDGPSSVILALLTTANLGLMTRLKRAGAAGFLYKPFTRAEMIEGLKPHLAPRERAAA